MELLGRKIAFRIAGMLLAFGFFDITVKAEGLYPILYDRTLAEEENRITIRKDPGEYEVEEGDSLWNIAEKMWGDGKLYPELVSCNQDIVSDPDLIYPGMVLTVSRVGYIERESGPIGMTTPEFCFDFPTGWKAVYLQSGEVGANLTISGGEDGKVACLIQKRMENTVPTVADWEEYIRKIEDHVQEKFPDNVSDLSFEHDQVNGEELYLYSYLFHIDGETYGMTGSLSIHVCAALRLSEHIQAEYIGFSKEEEIYDIVRYMGASFEELEMEGEELSVVMSIFPEFTWEAEGMYDSFSWIAGYFDSILQEIVDEQEEKTIRDRLLDP